MINIGIVGINGLVGRAILESIKRLNLINNIHYHFYGTYNTDNQEIEFNNQIHSILTFKMQYLHDLDYVILAVDNITAKNIYYYSQQLRLNIKIIDNSSEFRLDNNVLLCIPEINANILTNYIHQYYPTLIANPNCVTTLMCMVLQPLLNLGSIKSIVASTYQAASGAGYRGLQELETQTQQITNGENLTTDFWHRQYVYNVFSHNSSIDSETLYNEEELKLVNETKKILNINPKITATCIRVPTLRSHCISLHVEFNNILNKNDVINSLIEFPGIKVLDNIQENQFPEPILTSENTDVFVGRIRSDINDESCWNFFISGDQLLKGAGYNSVQILNKLLIIYNQ